MSALQILTPAEIGALSTELDIFSGGKTPTADLIEKNLYPPLPICSDMLIWGFEILRAAERQHLKGVNCLVIPFCPRVERLSLALKLEDRAGSFSWPEKERMWHFLVASETASEDQSARREVIEELTHVSPLIEDHPDSQLGTKIAAFATLPQALKILVGEAQLDLKNAARVRSLPEEVFAGLQSSTLTFSQRRQFLNELFEVSRKAELSQAETKELAGRAIRDPNPLGFVRRLRYPTLSELERRFSQLEEQLLKGSGVRIKPPPYFEGDAFTVEFEFTSGRSFNRRLDTLQTLEGRLDALLQLLH
jgi:hypothetical protein